MEAEKHSLGRSSRKRCGFAKSEEMTPEAAISRVIEIYATL